MAWIVLRARHAHTCTRTHGRAPFLLTDPWRIGGQTRTASAGRMRAPCPIPHDRESTCTLKKTFAIFGVRRYKERAPLERRRGNPRLELTDGRTPDQGEAVLETGMIHAATSAEYD